MDLAKTHWRDQYKFLKYQSKFHERIRQLFITSLPFKNFRCYQELQLKDLVPDCNRNYEIDWYIQELNTILELHGKQHYEATNFGNIDYHTNERNFYRSRERDNDKMNIALDAGFFYAILPYNLEKNITAASLMKLIEDQINGRE